MIRTSGSPCNSPAGPGCWPELSTTIFPCARSGLDCRLNEIFPRAMLVLHGLIRVHMTSLEGRQITIRYARACERRS
jgi:hypothetical protein